MRRRGADCRAASFAAVVVAGAYAGACGGGGGGGSKPPVYTPVAATSDGNVFTLTLGDLKMVVDASWGGRVTEWSFRGTNALVTVDENINYGSTYWPSPQAAWCAAGGGCWPPPDAIDMGAYTGGIDRPTNSIQLGSGAQALGGIAGSMLTVTKQFTPVPESGAVDVTYTLTNASPTDSVSLAPWQTTRVEAGGLTFFGQGSGAVTYAPDTASTFMVNETGGDLWYQSAPVTHDSKAFADGTGWIAQVTPVTADAPDRLLYLVSYPDIQPADAAPGEAEIELFTNSGYVEVETQGALTAIAPGGSLTWTLRWKLRPVSGSTTITPGSAALTSLAAATAAE